MAASEGIRRIKWLAKCLTGTGVVGVVSAYVISMFNNAAGPQFVGPGASASVNAAPVLGAVIGGLGAPLIVLGALLWALGWILEGFLLE